ncbi:hypothetical protein Cni_G13896 [Canna indica]|uniref:BED-type domain-containing protein n=1 Tax=Canna indica TaxID=4628 RepID=A0AAQ3KB06_9LILI|nr:hypothetical protein Cni_G13896 [Canna indica]
MESSSSSSRKDPGWKYLREVIPNNTNRLICGFCDKITNRGISRGKQHLVGGYRNVKACTKCPPHVREEIKEYMGKKAATSSVNFDASSSIPDFEDLDYGEEEEGLQRSAKKKPNVKGPLDLLFTPSDEEVVKKRKETMMKQTTINEAYQEVMGGLLDAIERLVPRFEEQDLISNQLSIYANSDGIFGKPMAIRHRSIKSPEEPERLTRSIRQKDKVKASSSKVPSHRRLINESSGEEEEEEKEDGEGNTLPFQYSKHFDYEIDEDQDLDLDDE